jgi:hypothetical protein
MLNLTFAKKKNAKVKPQWHLLALDVDSLRSLGIVLGISDACLAVAKEAQIT